MDAAVQESAHSTTSKTQSCVNFINQCPKCGKARAVELSACGTTITVPNLCDCQLEAERRQLANESAIQIQAIQRNWNMPKDAFDGWDSKENPKVNPLMAHAKAYADSWTPGAAGILYIGTNGSGKSRLVNMACNRIAAVHGVLAIAVESAWLFDNCKPNQFHDPMDLIEIPVLGLNDIANVRTEWEIALVEKLIDSRQDKTTLCSMDVEPGAWLKAMERRGDLYHVQAKRIVSRAQGACEPKVIPAGALDYRPIKRAKGVAR